MPIYPIAANVQVSATALPLPDGASTEATLSAVNNKLPALVAGKIPVSGTVALDSASLDALENISVTFPATQNVSVSNFPATQPVTDNGGSLTVDGTVTAAITVTDINNVPNAVGVNFRLPVSITDADSSLGGVQYVGALQDGDGLVFGLDRSFPVSGTVTTYPQQGTTGANTNFSDITSAELAPAVANRESLTVYNEGPGTLFINVGGSCSTTSYQVRLFSGEYWECPQGQQAMAHSAIFQSAGTARVTQVS
jgi:hypothetical protein